MVDACHCRDPVTSVGEDRPAMQKAKRVQQLYPESGLHRLETC